MSILATTGYVGIGSSNPAVTLDVAGTIRTTNIASGSTQCVQASASGVLSGTGSACGSGGGGSGTVTSSTAGQVAYYQSTGTVVIGTSTITITGGQVGVGTATPTTALTVNGNIDAMGANGYLTEIANGSVATVLNSLAKLDTSGHATAALSSDTDGMVGVVVGNAGTSGKAQVAMNGQAACTFDGTTTAGDFVTISGTNAGYCHDTGSTTRSATAQTIGRALTVNSGSGTTATVALGLNAFGASGSAVGIGTANYIPMWSNSTTLTNSVMYQSGGNVGIGTTVPVGNLDVRAGTDERFDILAHVNNASGISMRSFNDANSTYEPMEFEASEYSVMNGSIGIGTTGPARNLHIYGSNSGIAIQDFNSGGHQYVLTNYNTGDGSMGLYDSTSSAFRWLVNSSGNVGIGTTSPAGLFDVRASSTDNLLVSGHHNLSNGGSIYSVNDANSSVEGMEFGASSYYFGGGSVGIGTTNPQSNLDVASSGAGTLLVRDSAGANGTLRITNSGNNYIESGASTASASTAPLYFTDMNASHTWMVIGATGNVGIGSTSPVNTLDVNGTGIHIASGVPSPTTYQLYNNGGTLTWNGTALGTGSGATGTGATGYDAIWTSAIAIGTGLLYESGSKVGIGTTAPQSLVHAYGGEVQVGASGASCTSANAGAMRYSNGYMSYCNATAWTVLNTCSGSSGADTSLASGLAAYWNFNEGGGTTVNDDTGNGNTGTWQGTLGSQWTTGKIGYAGNFDGTDNYVSTSYAGVTGTSARSISLWFKTTSSTLGSSSNSTPLFSYGSNANGAEFTIATNDNYGTGTNYNGITLDSYGGAITYTASIYDGNWHYLVVIVPSSLTVGSVLFYLDGLQLATVNHSNTTTRAINTSSGTTVEIGSYGGANFFTGQIDEVGIWNMALTSAQVSSLYNAGAGNALGALNCPTFVPSTAFVH